MKQPICILLRVFNRIDDLKYCVDIIRDTWKNGTYHIIVVFNGADDGYEIPQETLGKIDKLLVIKNNTGHFSGNSKLLLEGLKHIPDNCAYTVILEADTWIYGDDVVLKYVNQLKANGAVWASAQFFRYVRNLATDFAIVDTAFVKRNPDVFKFDKTPEYFVANYLAQNKQKYIYITENMPVNLPRYVKKYPFAPTGRFFTFLKGKMVTHHIEQLKRGMDEKMYYFNLAANKRYFDVQNIHPPGFAKLMLKLSMYLSVVIPYKSWFVHTKNH